MEDSAPRRGRVTFGWLVGLSQVLGLVSVVLAGVWMGQYKGGFAWDGSAQQFNVHPLCMVLGLVFLQGDAILVYRVFHNEAKRNIKILHGIIHLLALGISIIGFVAVFNFHKVAKIPDMYSLHSWVGMATIVLFFLQWVIGLLFFLFPVASSWLRASYLPIHVFCGLGLLVMSIGSCLLGITEKLLFSLPTYSQFIPEGVLANVLGVLLVCFGGVVCYMVTKEDYRRPPNPEEESLSVYFKTLTEGQSPSSP
ncbi:transmembrane ascorbate-dependent reductase CYB561 [Takifugu rubripes]|uniref:Transmembrane ascorbate-dependent reductase CYB561 n=1 Tax=Takifugu rubripes TaxID=31033 RepID=H2TYT3_TAKRU|nr:cytochrome b561 [Takifugu rubripes]XP_011601879.2 cytochrome b561 [Takifugu rubripes]XP_011601880.2 cytochrome b561 [Takifugu rubripes]